MLNFGGSPRTGEPVFPTSLTRAAAGHQAQAGAPPRWPPWMAAEYTCSSMEMRVPSRTLLHT
eukprot:6210801-Pleurochrysis_carterae.AAC.3